MNRKWNSINSKETERSKIEIETEFLQFSNPRSKTKVKWNWKQWKQEIKVHSSSKALRKLLWKFQKESSLKTWILSYLYTFQNDLQALSWAFVLDGIGLKEALVDCSWRLKKNRSEPIEPVLRLAKVGPKVWA